jgi:hypothetical protein
LFALHLIVAAKEGIAMKKAHLVTICLSVIFAVAAMAVHTDAQVSIVLSSSQKPTPELQRSCMQEHDVLVRLLNKYPTPKKWTFFIVCDDFSWNQYVAKQVLNGRVAPGLIVYGETFRESGKTLIRGSQLLTPDPMMSPDKIAAHELAHIFLNTENEDKVSSLTTKWLDQEERHPGSLIAQNNTLAVAQNPSQP